MAEMCTADCGCKGVFRKSGDTFYLKSNATPTATSAGSCLYQRLATACSPPPSCVPVAGYTAFPNSDHPGDDIRNVAGVANAVLGAACDADLRCNGFNAQGWLKRSASVVLVGSGFCLYQRDHNPGSDLFPCEDLLTYTSPGPNCTPGNTTADCPYLVDGGTCQGWAICDTAIPAICQDSCSSCKGCTPNVFVRGAVLSSVTVSSMRMCRAECRMSPPCNFASWNHTTRECMLKYNLLAGGTGVYLLIDEQGDTGVSGTCFVTPDTSDKYVCVPNVDIKGDQVSDLVVANTLGACRQYCDRQPACAAFVWGHLFDHDNICNLKQNLFVSGDGANLPNAAYVNVTCIAVA